MRFLVGAITVAFTASGLAAQTEPAATAPAAPAYTWPKYQTQRFMEDYSGLRSLDSIPARDWADTLKFIPITSDRGIWLSIGGQSRARIEGFHNFEFGTAPNNDDNFYFLHRHFLWGDLHIGPNVRVFVEGKSAWTEDRDLPGGTRTVDQDALDFHNAFGEVSVPFDCGVKFTVRGGRQELLYGRQRLISPLDWVNARRTFDGVVARVAGADWSVDGFWSQPVIVKKHDLNEADADQDFWGLYSTFKNAFGSTVNFDAYFLGQNIDRMIGDVDRYTLGTRIWGPLASTGLDYEVEGGWQFGDFGSMDIRAFFVTGEVSKTFKDCEWKPVVTVGVDYASGDSNAADGKVETFNQLFPLGHAYLGYVDLIGRQNIIDLRASGKVSPTEKLWLQADLHSFWLADTNDALYNAGGGIVRPATPGADSFVGVELDLSVGYTFDHHLKGLIGYSHVFAGQFISDTGPDEDIDFWYAQLEFTF